MNGLRHRHEIIKLILLRTKGRPLSNKQRRPKTPLKTEKPREDFRMFAAESDSHRSNRNFSASYHPVSGCSSRLARLCRRPQRGETRPTLVRRPNRHSPVSTARTATERRIFPWVGVARRVSSSSRNSRLPDAPRNASRQV
jgi:hypothetical protein